MSYMSNLAINLSQLVSIAEQHYVKSAYIAGNAVIIESYYTYRGEQGQLRCTTLKERVRNITELKKVLGY